MKERRALLFFARQGRDETACFATCTSYIFETDFLRNVFKKIAGIYTLSCGIHFFNFPTCIDVDINSQWKIKLIVIDIIITIAYYEIRNNTINRITSITGNISRIIETKTRVICKKRYD